MDIERTSRSEIASLHEFFTQWFTGRCEAQAISRLETALSPSFRMVHPDGSQTDRSSVIDAIERGYAVHEWTDFGITIEEVELRYDLGDHAVVRYEEWQTLEGDQTGRISTVVFERVDDEDRPLRWLDVHETSIETPEG